MIILSILIDFALDNLWMSLGENCVWSPLGLKWLIERRSMMSCYHGSKISGSQQQAVVPFGFNPENVANI